MPKPERVGFIFECGRGGPDFQVCQHFLSRLNPSIEMIPIFLDNTERLLTECGSVAEQLLGSDKCARVVVVWDLEPAWEQKKKPCRREDRLRALESLNGAKVPWKKVLLMCIVRELECWLMADTRAVTTVLAKYKHPHPVGRIPDFRKPDTQIKRPKTQLIRLFQQERGDRHKYVDRDHALLLAKSVPDWSHLRRSDSFVRFATKVAGVAL